MLQLCYSSFYSCYEFVTHLFFAVTVLWLCYGYLLCYSIVYGHVKALLPLRLQLCYINDGYVRSWFMDNLQIQLQQRFSFAAWIMAVMAMLQLLCLQLL